MEDEARDLTERTAPAGSLEFPFKRRYCQKLWMRVFPEPSFRLEITQPFSFLHQ